MRVELFAGGNGGGMRALLGTDVQKVVAHPSEPLFPQFGDLLLILKQITDEISVICPDHSLQDISDLISDVLPPGHDTTDEDITEDIAEDDGVRDKFVLSHVMDTDQEAFQQHSEDHLVSEPFRSSEDEDENSNIGLR